jgi:aspartate kinase
MLVMKFGGTSVGSAERFLGVADIVRNSKAKNGAPLVVLSAMSGVTNQLIEGATIAKERDLDGALEIIGELRERHRDVICTLFQDSATVDKLTEELEAYFKKLDILYRGVSYLGELTKRSMDAISGLGELFSSKIFTNLLIKQKTDARWLDAREFVITDNVFGRATPLLEMTSAKAQGAIMPEIAAGKVVVTQGFIGSTSSGITTTLGRGGSDYSASILGVATDADEIQIWTDVDGMLSADPRVVPEAAVIKCVSFQEASELAYFGAKVLHPLTIKPAVEKSIPVRILNSMHPERPGTVITEEGSDDAPICAIASKKNITALFISSLNMLMAHGYLARVFTIFDRFRTSIDLISTSEVSISVTIDNTENLDEIVEALEELSDVRVVEDAAIVSVVGKQFRKKSGIAGEVFDTLKDINILMISGGASEINLSFVVSNGDADAAVRKLHKTFFAQTKSLS